MGRASNRKKAQRQAGGPNLRRIEQDARSQAVAARSAFGLDAMVQFAGERVRRRAIALRAWLGDTETGHELRVWPDEEKQRYAAEHLHGWGDFLDRLDTLSAKR